MLSEIIMQEHCVLIIFEETLEGGGGTMKCKQLVVIILQSQHFFQTNKWASECDTT